VPNTHRVIGPISRVEEEEDPSVDGSLTFVLRAAIPISEGGKIKLIELLEFILKCRGLLAIGYFNIK